jgi:phosphate transport system substrate-binding protein
VYDNSEVVIYKVMKKLFVALLASAGLVACSSPKEVVSLNAAGATFPAPLYQAWFQALAQQGEYQVNYQAVGSGAGVRQYNAGTTDFGASDKALSDNKVKRPVVQIPMTGGAIVPAYNLPDCNVAMTQKELADVFLGKITNWSEFGCEDKQIVVVYRSDGSGTTAGFTSSLSAFSTEFAERIGSGKAVPWVVGVGSKGNAGVAGTISQQLGAIGYLNYGYVAGGKFQQVALENKTGNFVTANSETSAAGLSQIQLDDKLRGSDPNPAGENAYPIVSLTWVLAHPEHSNNDAMKAVFTYMLSDDAQSMSDGLGYVPLPENIRELALQSVNTLQ